MDSSVLRWRDVNFVAGKGKNEKHILRDVGGKVSWGHTLAIMGPSGAGSKYNAVPLLQNQLMLAAN